MSDYRVPERSDTVDDEEIFEDMRRVYDELERVPTRDELATHGRFSEAAYRRVGDSSHAVALVCADVVDEPPSTGPRAVPTGTVLEDIRRVRADLGRWPTGNEYNEHGEYTWQLLGQRLDASFTEVLDLAREIDGEE